MKKICILTTSYPTFIENSNEFPPGKFVHDMAKYLVKASYKTYVITHRMPGTPKKAEIDNVKIYRFNYFIPGFETLTKANGIPENIKKHKNKLLVPLYFFTLFIRALVIIKRKKIDIINPHWVFPTGYIGLLLKRVTKKQLVVTSYGAELFPTANGKMQYLKPFLKRTINEADQIAGISKATVDAAKKISGREDIKIIPDGIDIEYYKPGEKNFDILKKYHASYKKVIFYTGRMVERKGHIILLESMQHVIKNIPDIKLILGGKGPLFEKVSNRRDELGLIEHVELPGFLPEEDIVPLLQSADLYVLPSCIDSNGDTEGSATVALEAMACGTPAIISNIGGNVGAVPDNNGAVYFSTNDDKELAQKIIEALTNRNLLDMSNKARLFITSEYSWPSIIKQYDKIFGL